MPSQGDIKGTPPRLGRLASDDFDDAQAPSSCLFSAAASGPGRYDLIPRRTMSYQIGGLFT